MATRKIKKVAEPKKLTASKPKFPYTTAPSSLRRILQEIPKRPKPDKFDWTLINSWGIKDNNARTAIKVLEQIGLVDGGDAPTQHYTDYMKNDTGPANLAARIKSVYTLLFQTSHEPYKDTQENLKNFFNINSGGGEATINFQIQTFKILSEFANFTAQANPSVVTPDGGANNPGSGVSNAIVNINLHIHLPETKSRADYEEIIKDIAKYIYQK